MIIIPSSFFILEHFPLIHQLCVNGTIKTQNRYQPQTPSNGGDIKPKCFVYTCGHEGPAVSSPNPLLYEFTWLPEHVFLMVSNCKAPFSSPLIFFYFLFSLSPTHYPSLPFLSSFPSFFVLPQKVNIIYQVNIANFALFQNQVLTDKVLCIKHQVYRQLWTPKLTLNSLSNLGNTYLILYS